MGIDRQPSTIKILSVLLAVILWVYVSNEQRNPVAEREINVALESAGLEQDYLITAGLPESVRVKVQGNEAKLAALTSGDFRAQVSIPLEKTGLVTVPVLVSAPQGLQTQVYPNEVSVVIDVLAEKTIPVTVSLQGKAAPGHNVQTTQCYPAAVTAKGPGMVINELKQVTAVVDIESAVQSIERDLPVTAGNPVVTLSPDTVRVIVPITHTDLTKTVPIQPQVTGVPANGFKITQIKAEPEFLQITGPAEILDNIVELKTIQVDVQGADESFIKEINLLPVPGIAGVEANRVIVQVTINKGEALTQPPAENDEVTRQNI